LTKIFIWILFLWFRWGCSTIW